MDGRTHKHTDRLQADYRHQTERQTDDRQTDGNTQTGRRQQTAKIALYKF